MVADVLLARGAPDAAEAFAKAAPRRAVEGLPAYVVAQKDAPVAPAARASAAGLAARLAKGDLAGVLEAAEGIDAPARTVPGVLAAYAAGVALLRSGRPAEALDRLRAAGRAAEGIGWLRRAAWCRLQEGNCIRDGGELAETWEAALALAEAAGDARLEGILLESLGETYRQMRAFDRALACQERAVRVAEETADRAALGISLGDIGLIHKDRGDFLRALAYKERALGILEEAGERARAAQTVGHIGCLLQQVGDLRKALEFQERALRLSAEAGDKAGVAGAHVNLASVHEALGDYGRALSHGETALRLMEELGDARGMATVLGNMGNLRRKVGEANRALALYERALHLAEQAGDLEIRAATLGNVAAALCSLGDLRGARERMEQALAMREEIGNKAWEAIALDGLGVIHRALGDPAKALACAEKALSLSREAGDRIGMAAAQANIGRICLDRRDFEGALARLDAARRLQAEVGDADGTARTLWGLCAVHAAKGDPASAVACAREAVTLASNLGRGLSDDLLSSAREQFGDLYGCGALSAAALDDPAGVAFFLESGRAGALRESLLNRDAIRGFALPDALREAETLARSRESAAASALREAVAAADATAARRARAALEAAREEIREVAGRVQREAKAAASLFSGAVDDLGTIRGRLEPGEALLLYGIFPGEDALALVVTAKEARIVPLGRTSEIEDACRALTPYDAGAEAAPGASRLRRLVLDPLGTNAARLLVSPDGPLSRVPFALLAPDREFVSVPSGTTHGILLGEKGKRGQGVLALGDPDPLGDAGEGILGRRGGTGPLRLPGTAAEAKAVGDVVLLGKEASEAALSDALATRSRWRAVHFACHGLLDEERPMLSCLALAPAGDDDGFLTALEVFRMRVPADLVVLSACETGRGRFFRGEGTVGLARAFLFAGAPRVLVSLWKVDDDATRALMGSFYEAWKAGKPAASALHDAQAFVRSQERWRHPAYWAAWVLWGLPD